MGPDRGLTSTTWCSTGNYVYKGGGFKRMSTAAKEDGQNVAHELLSFEGSDGIVIKEPGYVYIWAVK